jgi:ABC-type transport system substrate-binding protein
LLCAALLSAATRPRYGGVLRVEIREEIETADPPTIGRGIADLNGAFNVTRWEAGRRAAFEANENAPGGRPFLDSVEITMGRPLREQSIDLELGKTDVIELGPAEIRRQAAGRKIWSSSPVRVLALVFHSRTDDARVREALALAVDRSAIQNVLLQRQGEVSGALLPQWLSGYAFLFPSVADLARARALAVGAKRMVLSVEDPALLPIAERIALNARDAGLAITVGTAGDVSLMELRVNSSDPARALAGMAAAAGLPEPPHPDSAEALYAAERALLDGHRIIPLIHLPDVYGAGPRVRGGPGITPLGEWRFENLWLEGGRP